MAVLKKKPETSFAAVSQQLFGTVTATTAERI
jgi:hypothetical protein